MATVALQTRRGAPEPPARRAGSDRTARSGRSSASPQKSLPNPLGPLPALRAPARRRPRRWCHTEALCFLPAGPGCVPPGFRPRPGSALSGPPEPQVCAAAPAPSTDVQRRAPHSELKPPPVGRKDLKRKKKKKEERKKKQNHHNTNRNSQHQVSRRLSAALFSPLAPKQ